MTKSRVLLIEDEVSAQQVYCNRLTELGHEVVGARTGAMGLMEARAGRFDLFLVDVHLGSGIDGLEVCRRLKSVPELAGIPVVLISGQVNTSQDLHRGYEAGCQAFLKKGDLSLLEDVVRAMLRQKGLQDDLGSQNRLLEDQYRRLEALSRAKGMDTEGKQVPMQLALPEAVVVVDGDGICHFADRGAQALFRLSLDGKNLAELTPASGLAALVRDTRTEPHAGHRFTLNDHAGRPLRTLSVCVTPFLPSGRHDDGLMRLVSFFDSQDRARNGTEEHALPERGILREAARTVYHPSALIGECAEVRFLRRRLAFLANLDMPVWITGEPGTETDLVANVLHYSSQREGSFVRLDCAALPAVQLEAELFGSKEDGIPGILETVRGGTLFLLSIEKLPPSLSERLEQELRDSDVRLLVATLTDLSSLQTADALQRIRQECELFSLPPLRDRDGDLVHLARHFLKLSSNPDVGLSAQGLWLLQQYSWPGNLDELRRCLSDSAERASGEEIEVYELASPLQALYKAMIDDNVAPPMPSSEPVAENYDEADEAELQEGVHLLQVYEKRALLSALRKANGDKLKAAKLAGVGKSTFYRKLKIHGIT